MAVSNQVVRAVYTGNGTTDTFAIPFQFTPPLASEQTKVYLANDTTGEATLQVEGSMADYVLDPPYHVTTNPNGPVNVIFTTAPAIGYSVIVTRELPLTQIISYMSNGAFPAKSHEYALDRLTFMIQQLFDVVSRNISTSPVDPPELDLELPPFQSDSVLATSPSTYALEWVARSAFKGDKGDKGDPGVAGIDGVDGINGTNGTNGTNGADGAPGVGVPTGGTANQILYKVDGTDYNTAWKTPDPALPTGGTIGQILTKNSGTDGDASWAPRAQIFGSPGTPKNITPSTGLSNLAANMDDTAWEQVIFVKGNSSFGANVSASPQIQAGSMVGQIMRLVGASNVDCITFVDGTGLRLNGPWPSFTNTTLTLMWSGSLWIEIGRTA